MAFWGVEVRPGKPYTHVYDATRGRLRVSQATLGNGKGTTKSVLQCNVGKKSPILLCSLFPDKTETCHLELEFEEDDEVVFSVLGQRSVHLSGYYLGSSRSGRGDGDETDSYGEDIGEEDSEGYDSFGSDEDEYESDFIDDDVEMFPASPKRKSSVIIEEIVEDDKPTNGNGNRRRLKKKSQLIDSDDENDDSQCQLVVKSSNAAMFESEDEDGFPISFSLQKKDADENIEGNKKAGKKTVDDDRKRKIDAISQSIEPMSDACKPSDSSAASDKVPETKDTSKKKKIKDDTTGGLGNTEQIQDTDHKDAEANAETLDNNHLVGGADVVENEGKLKKKKKDNTRKNKKTDVVDSAMDGTEDGVNASNVDQKDHFEAEKSHTDIDESIGGKKRKNKKKKAKDDATQEKAGAATEVDEPGRDKQNMESKLDGDATKIVEEPPKDEVPNGDDFAQKTKKKKTKKEKNSEKALNMEEPLNISEAEEKDGSHKTRTFSNGLTIEELSMGKPDGKKAAPGSKVSVNYIGKLKNGKFFDSNVGKRPFKFRLGVGHVIKGWDVGVAGMRVGDKRRLVVPPSMGYGDANMGKIPANSWLVFDVELVDVN
ncbi:peptidyl-prolyl cis-trans isomerase FKBP53 [Canna indica]|uniref:peptidylprolyl isomerase n=1 Tax=Canna indica TaxID=4628 RepID=A0AAQ3L430_9LILI|nr:peptidyl-prolyl cis-trans isomerase FKBP53 [Canna indica]